MINIPSYFTEMQEAPVSFAQVLDRQLSSPYDLISDHYVEAAFRSTSDRTIKIVLNKETSLLLPYYPSVYESLKFRFARYFGFFVVAYLIFHQLLIILIREEGIECQVID